MSASMAITKVLKGGTPVHYSHFPRTSLLVFQRLAELEIFSGSQKLRIREVGLAGAVQRRERYGYTPLGRKIGRSYECIIRRLKKGCSYDSSKFRNFAGLYTFVQRLRACPVHRSKQFTRPRRWRGLSKAIGARGVFQSGASDSRQWGWPLQRFLGCRADPAAKTLGTISIRAGVRVHGRRVAARGVQLAARRQSPGKLNSCSIAFSTP